MVNGDDDLLYSDNPTCRLLVSPCIHDQNMWDSLNYGLFQTFWLAFLVRKDEIEDWEEFFLLSEISDEEVFLQKNPIYTFSFHND